MPIGIILNHREILSLMNSIWKRIGDIIPRMFYLDPNGSEQQGSSKTDCKMNHYR